MKVLVRLTQFDILEGTSSTLVEGTAIARNHHLLYFEEDGKSRHDISFLPDEIVLKRNSEISSETHLPFVGEGTCVVHSPYGPMCMEAQLLDWKCEEHRWSVEYKLLQQKQVTAHMRMVWEIRSMGA